MHRAFEAERCRLRVAERVGDAIDERALGFALVSRGCGAGFAAGFGFHGRRDSMSTSASLVFRRGRFVRCHVHRACKNSSPAGSVRGFSFSNAANRSPNTARSRGRSDNSESASTDRSAATNRCRTLARIGVGLRRTAIAVLPRARSSPAKVRSCADKTSGPSSFMLANAAPFSVLPITTGGTRKMRAMVSVPNFRDANNSAVFRRDRDRLKF